MNDQMEEMLARCRRRGAALPGPLQVPPGTSTCSPIWKLPELCPFGCLGRIHFVGMIDRISWPLVINSAVSPFPLGWGWAGGWKLQLSNHMVGFSGDQPSSWGYLETLPPPPSPAISYAINIQKILITLEILRDLGAVCQEWGAETKFVFIML